MVNESSRGYSVASVLLEMYVWSVGDKHCGVAAKHKGTHTLADAFVAASQSPHNVFLID